MSATRYSISWIYGEFKIARMQKGLVVENWISDFPVTDLESLCQAMSKASREVDLNQNGDLAIVYEDDQHIHEFLAVPNMDKKELEKLLQRKVMHNKTFEGPAAWCYHEARHESEDEGIMLHLLPQHIVDSTVRICQEFYLTPKRLVPISEIISEIILTYGQAPNHVLVIAALFKERTEIVITLGSGEVLFVRELPYSSYEEGVTRLVTDINRTIRYAKQRFGVIVDSTWLMGEHVDQIHAQINNDIESPLNFDPNSLDPLFWTLEVANLTGQISANFIPLLARKRINRTLFFRIGLWLFGLVFMFAIGINSSIEYAIAKQSIDRHSIHANISDTQQQINRLDNLIAQADKGKKELLVLQADAQNLPALFVSYLGNITPNGLIITLSKIHKNNNNWLISVKGISTLSLTEMAPLLIQLENTLIQEPWNMTVKTSWHSSWYEQLKQGAAASTGDLGFEIAGWMK